MSSRLYDLSPATAGGCSACIGSTPPAASGFTAAAPVEPPMRLAQVSYGPDGEMLFPRHGHTAPESALKTYLEKGARLLRTTVPPDMGKARRFVSAEFEHLRWFDLPPMCLEQSPAEGP